LAQLRRSQLGHDVPGLGLGRRVVFLGMDRLQHRSDFPHPLARYVGEGVAAPVHDAALPARLVKALGGTLDLSLDRQSWKKITSSDAIFFAGRLR
jgi:hypothetical protein